MDKEERDRVLGLMGDLESDLSTLEYEMSRSEPDVDQAGCAADMLVETAHEIARAIPTI